MAEGEKRDDATQTSSDVAFEQAAAPVTDETTEKTDADITAVRPVEGEKSDKADKTDKPADPAPATDPAADPVPKAPAAKHRVPVLACVALVAVFFVAGLLVGRLMNGDTGTISLDGRTTLAASELDSAIATYTYNGETYSITAREIIDEMGGTDELVNDDGTYDVPAAGDVVTYAQNQIILADAEERGLTATDEETDELAEETFGTTDYDTIYESYGYDEEYIQTIATITKLREAVVDVTIPDLPDAPDYPDDGEEDVATAEYAAYVIELLGDEWDSETGTWASTDGDYYATLSSYEFTADAATYDVALAAYQVAYTQYTEAYSEFTEEWTTYTRNLLSNATIQIGSLVAS